jgi:hypothetical protein
MLDHVAGMNGYWLRLWLAIHLGRWSHRWLLTMDEILAFNEAGYIASRELAGLKFPGA